MGRLTHIFTGTDFSAGSSAALERCFLIAKAAGARCSVIHAIDHGAAASLRRLFKGEFDLVSNDAENKARKRLAELASDASKKYQVSAETRVDNGPGWAAVCAGADASDAALIVVGAHGTGLFSRASVGSTASRILHQSGKPVLIVKGRPSQAYTRVLVATDFSPVSAATVRLARAIAPGAEIILMHAFEEPLFEETVEYGGDGAHIVDRYRERAHRELRELGAASALSEPEFSVLVVGGDAKQEILAQTKKLECDLIVMGKHGNGFIDDLLLGSVTNRVLTDSEIDVLIVVDEREPDLWRYAEDRGAKAKLLHSDRFDIGAWGAGGVGPLKTVVAGEIGEAIVEALRDAFSKSSACEFNFGTMFEEEDVETRPTDLVMTLPFVSGDDAWRGPLLLISLENIVQEQIDKFDASDGSVPDLDELMKLRDGLHMLANRINLARIRSATKIARRIEREAPLF